MIQKHDHGVTLSVTGSLTKKNMKERFVAAVPDILLSFRPHSFNTSTAYIIISGDHN